ncbi:MAG TPA: acetamidase/formamidase family protein [Candidatus Limnocylindria bacterium]|nr:acetamidase/formamidase family protein [Candidatus Limnocylindria bacterium]
MSEGETLHVLRATPDTCFWGFFDRSRPPVLTVRSGDTVHVETLTHQAGDAPDLMMDEGVRAVYEGIPAAQRGPGVHLMTGPIAVEGARAGDTLEVRILAMRPRLPYGTNIGAWWGYLYPEMQKERITIYAVDAASGYAQAAFAFDYEHTPKYDAPGTIIPPERTRRTPALDGVLVPLRPHFGVMGVAPRESGKVNSIPPGDFGGNVDDWRIGPGATMYYPVLNDGALFFVGDPHAAEGDAELSGTAIESSHDGWIQIVVRRDLPTDSPLLETATHWYTHGFGADLDEAMRAAALRMLAFLQRRFGLSRDDAYSFLSVACDFGVTQVVDQRMGVHAAAPKAAFPPRATR